MLLSNSFRSIDDGAFDDCSSFMLMLVPNSFRSIDDGAYDDCF
jgi:hypothetical protein